MSRPNFLKVMENSESVGSAGVSCIDIRNLKRDVKFIDWPPVTVEMDVNDSSKDTENSDDLSSNLHFRKKRKVLRMRRKKIQSVIHLCKECSARFPSAIALAIHLQTHYSKKIICLACQKSFPDKLQLDAHLRQVHTQQKNISCSKCRKTFTYRSYLSNIKSKDKINQKEDFICFFCNKKSISRTKSN